MNEIIREKFSNISDITLFTNITCNLNCKFCFLHKSKVHAEENVKVLKAWKDGSYIETAKKVIERLGQKPSQIKSIQLWGGETFLNINYLNNEIPHLFKTFRNIESFNFSTNFISTVNVEKSCDFIKLINDNTNSPTSINYQVSIDGVDEKFLIDGHPGSWEKSYSPNFTKLISFINNTKLPNIKVINLIIKPTIDRELYIKEFSDIKKLEKYMMKFVNKGIEIDNQIVCEKIKFFFEFPCPALPSRNYSVSDGIELGKIVRNWDYLKLTTFKPYLERFPRLKESMALAFTRYKNEFTYENKNQYCGIFTSSLPIMIDGTCVSCVGTFLEHNKEYQEELINNNDYSYYYSSKIFSKQEFNPLNMNDDQIIDFIWARIEGEREANLFPMAMKIALMKECALSGQIPYNFAISETDRLQHLTTMAPYGGSCTRENIFDTFTPFLQSPGYIRQFFNGVSDHEISKIKSEVLNNETNK